MIKQVIRKMMEAALIEGFGPTVTIITKKHIRINGSWNDDKKIFKIRFKLSDPLSCKALIIDELGEHKIKRKHIDLVSWDINKLKKAINDFPPSYRIHIENVEGTSTYRLKFVSLKNQEDEAL